MTKKNGISFRAAKGRGEIILYGDIGFDITAADFSRELKALGKVEAIDVRINSFCGDVFDGVTIHSRLAEHPATIDVAIDGIAASAASVIAMAGDAIRIAEAGFVMIHDAWGLTVGNAEDHRRQADRLEAVSAQIAGVYERRTGQEMTQIRKWMAMETEFNADQSVEFGFATDKFEAQRMVAKFDPDRHHFRRSPTMVLPGNKRAAARMIAEMRMHLAA